MKKKVLAVTGIRSEYDILYPVIEALGKDKLFDVKVVACGAHLSEMHGVTVRRIEQDKFDIVERIDYLLMSNRKSQRPKGIGILVYGLTQAVEREKPDFLLVVGDREESIATAIVGNYLDIPVAHIGGGDTVFGNSDDPIRHGVSKLAHIHFAFAQRHCEILRKTGEEAFRIFRVGNPGIDRIRLVSQMSLMEISNKLKFDLKDGNFVILINHPLSSENTNSYEQMKIILESLQELGEKHLLKTVVIYPNTDPGCFDILRAMELFKGSQKMRFYKTLPREIFVNLLRHALALVGNSSLGILEAPYLSLPVVNVGNRQKGRFTCGNVVFVNHVKSAIKKQVVKSCFDIAYRKYIRSLKNDFGDGYASKRITRILKTVDSQDKKWKIKKLSYLST